MHKVSGQNDTVLPNRNADGFDWPDIERGGESQNRIIGKVYRPQRVCAGTVREIDQLLSVQNPTGIQWVFRLAVADEFPFFSGQHIDEPHLSLQVLKTAN